MNRWIVIVLYLLLIWLLAVTHTTPIKEWKLPCYAFCITGIIWFTPDIIKIIRSKHKDKGDDDDDHKDKD
jgi:hypothetical protein